MEELKELNHLIIFQKQKMVILSVVMINFAMRIMLSFGMKRINAGL